MGTETMYDTPHTRYLKLADTTVGLRHKKILEIGGCTPPNLISTYEPSTWTSIDLDIKAVPEFNDQARALGFNNYSARVEDVTKLEQDNYYDLIYSINAFEHVNDLDKAFRKMYESLKPGGYLFTLFGPIWSSDVGHHLSLATERGPLHFFDGVLKPYEHLSSTPDAIQSKLSMLYSNRTAQNAIELIYRHPSLNRLYEQRVFDDC